jgi:hypothetical protein
MEPSSIFAVLIELGAIFARVTELSASIFVVTTVPPAAPATPLTAATRAMIATTMAGDGNFMTSNV